MRALKLRRKGFRDKPVPAPSIAQNSGKPRGRRTTAEDMVPHRMKVHAACNHTGVVWDKKRGRREVCKCATKKFMRAHPELIIDEEGHSWWPAGGAPEELERLAAQVVAGRTSGSA